MNPPQGLDFEAELLEMPCSMALSLPVPACPCPEATTSGVGSSSSKKCNQNGPPASL